MAIRRDDNKYTRLSLQEYNGQARNGEIVIDLDTYNVYVGDASGALLPISGGGGNLANAIIGNLTVTGTSNLGQVGNITILGGNPGEVLTTDGTGNLSWAPAGSGGYGNSNVSVYLAGNIPSNIIPLANAVQILGNVNNQWKEIWVDDVYINSIPLTTSGSQLTFNGVPVLTASGTEDIITSGNGQFDRVTATFGTFGQITGDGSSITNIGLANYANYAGNVVNANQPNITTVGTLVNLAIAGNAQVGGNVAVTGNLAVGTSLNYDTTTNTLSIAGTANVNQLQTESVTGLSPTITATGVNGGISLQTNGTGNVNVNGAIISSVATPVNPNDAANKAYVDAIASGLSIKPSVQLATDAPLPAYTYNNGTSGVGATIDIVMPDADPLLIEGQPALGGYRVLIKNEINLSQPYNGIYSVAYSSTTLGSVTTYFATLTRTSDFDEASEIPSAYVFDEYSGNGWVCTNVEPPAVVVGITPITWTQFSRAGQYSPGVALSQVGTDFNVNTDGVTVAVNSSNELEVPPNAQFVTPNIGSATGSNLIVTGNVGAANITATGLLTASESNLGPIGNVTVLGGTSGQVITTDGAGNLSFVTIPVGYGNSNVSVYLDGNIPTNIVPLSNAAQNLGSAANQWNNMWVGGTGHFVNLNAGNITITNSISGNGAGLSNITAANVVGVVANANYAAYAGNVVNANQPNITTVGTLTGLTVGGTAQISGNLSVGTLFRFDSANGNLSLQGTANVNQLKTDSIQGLSPVIAATGVNGGISLQTNGTGNVDVNSTNIVNVLDPVNPQDAATKAYVDAVASGLSIKPAVQLASNAALPAYTYSNGVAGVGATISIIMPNADPLLIEGQPALDGYRVLIKNEVGANQAYNGIYLVSYSATGGDIPSYNTILTRTTDCNQPSEFYSAFVFDQYSGNGWVCTNVSTSPITVGTTPITWTQFSQAGQYFAGSGLELVGSTFNALVDGTTVSINGSNELSIPPNAPLVTPNIGNATGSSLTLTGNATIGGVVTDNFYYANGTPITFVNEIIAGNNITISPVGGTGAVTINSTGGGNANIMAIPAVYFVAPTTGNNQTFSNTNLGLYATASDLTVFYNGVLLENDYYTLSGDVLTVNTILQTGDSVDIIRQFANAVPAPSYVAIPAVYFIAPTTGNNQTFTSSTLSQYGTTSDLTVFYNGSLLEEQYYSLTGSTLTVNTLLFSGDTIDIPRQLAGNVGTIATTYGDSNVLAYLSSGAYAGNIIPAGNNIFSLGNVTNQWKDLWVSNSTIYIDSVPISIAAGNVLTVGNANVVTTSPDGTTATTGVLTVTGNIVANTGYYFLGDGGLLSNITAGTNYSNANVANYLPTYLPTYAGNIAAGNATVTGRVTTNTVSLGAGNLSLTGNTLSTTSSTITIDPLNDGTNAGNVVVAGNLTVGGTLTFNNTVSATTNDLQWIAANNAANPSAATGAGLSVGPTGSYASFTFNAGANAWQSSLPIIANGGVNANGALTGATTGSFSGNVTAPYFLGNGSQLTGMYANADVANYLPTYTGNVGAGNVVSSGNVIAARFIGDGSQLTNLPVQPGTYSNANVTAYLPTYLPLYLSTYTGNVTADNVTASGTTATSNLTVTGNSALGSVANVSITGGIPGQVLTTSGTGVLTWTTPAGTYTNANVAAYLPTYTGNLSPGNITTTGNVTASYFIGDGSLLTGLPAGYANSDVAAYLASGTVNTDIITTGNTSTANLTVGANTTTVGLTVTGTTRLSDVGSVHIPGGNAGEVLITDGNGNLSFSPNPIYAVPPVYITAQFAGNNQQFSNAILASYNSNTDMTVFYNGSLLENTYYTLTGDVITVNVPLEVGDGIDVVTTVAANVTSFVLNYGNSNVATYLPTYTGAMTSLNGDVTTTADMTASNMTASNMTADNMTAANIIATDTTVVNVFATDMTSANIVAANITGDTLSTGAGNLQIAVNTLSSAADTITIDPLNDGTPAGNVVIAGNLQVAGNLTYNDVVNATTNDLQWIAANNAASESLATGAGLSVGPAGAYASFTYNSGSNAWQSSLPIIANGGVNANGALSGATTGSFSGNVTAPYLIGNGSQLTGMYDDANVASYLASNANVAITTTGNITSTANISGGNITATGSVVATNISASGAARVSTISSNVDIVLGNIDNTATTKTRITSDGAFSYIQAGNGVGGSTGNVVFSPMFSGAQRVVIDTSSGNITAAGTIQDNLGPVRSRWTGRMVVGYGSYTATQGSTVDVGATFTFPARGTYLVTYTMRGRFNNAATNGTMLLTDTSNNVLQYSEAYLGVNFTSSGGSVGTIENTVTSTYIITAAGPATYKMRLRANFGTIVAVSDGNGASQVTWVQVSVE